MFITYQLPSLLAFLILIVCYFQVESGVGYGHWVCRTLQSKKSQDSELYRYSIEQMAAVPAASDVLAAYTSRVKDNPTAYNMHGLLLEKQGLLSQACQAYNR